VLDMLQKMGSGIEWMVLHRKQEWHWLVTLVYRITVILSLVYA
jgi:hypothetical protein